MLRCYAPLNRAWDRRATEITVLRTFQQTVESYNSKCKPALLHSYSPCNCATMQLCNCAFLHLGPGNGADCAGIGGADWSIIVNAEVLYLTRNLAKWSHEQP